MRINLNEFRKDAMRAYGYEVSDDYHTKLPPEFNCKWISWRGFKLRVLTSGEAHYQSKTKARRPHRILAWCDKCGKWQFAGKLVQHQKACKKETV